MSLISLIQHALHRYLFARPAMQAAAVAQSQQANAQRVMLGVVAGQYIYGRGHIKRIAS